jgi:hypothetical protein
MSQKPWSEAPSEFTVGLVVGLALALFALVGVVAGWVVLSALVMLGFA